jgi:PPK2 family polyphosphate:nucleotide phosphotransferase
MLAIRLKERNVAFANVIDGSKKVKLADINPSFHDGQDKPDAEALTAKLGAEMAELFDLLFAAGKNSLLIVLQGRDTSGKDGTIRQLLMYTNAQSCRVIPFKVPTAEEVGHDFLWRIHQQTPGKGSIAIFNRSHYEDVLVVRVHDLVPEKVWKRRYEHINNFESNLIDSNTIILKFYLHISKDEQEERLLAREQETEKAWKLTVSDWKEREFWDDYTKAYEDAINRCSTPDAPWHIISANHKWFRNLAITESIVTTLRPYKSHWLEHLAEIGKTAKAELAAYRQGIKPTGK